jgi:two-component system chemotaxis response regulator CheY
VFLENVIAREGYVGRTLPDLRDNPIRHNEWPLPATSLSDSLMRKRTAGLGFSRTRMLRAAECDEPKWSASVKILIVDDTTIIRVILRRWCETLGMSPEDVVEAENGETALARFEACSPGAVVTDWSMPVMDGLTLVQEIRKRNAKIPIVMVTSQAERQHVVAAVEAGANDYLVKPFSPPELRKKLSKLIVPQTA